MATGDWIRTERPYYSRVTVFHGEIWYDAFPQFVDPVTLAPWDISSVTIEVILRPQAPHDTRFVLLSSASSGIIIEDGPNGLAAIHYPKASVEANLPISLPTQPWWQMQRLSWTDAELGAVKKILAEGPLIVLPGRDTA